METQLKKGVLDMCVLNILARGEFYGYELVSRISRKIQISEGTIYPLLRRLKNEGLVTTYLVESKEGPPRKYYKLTTDGKKKAKELAESWRRFSQQVDSVLDSNPKAKR